MNKIKVMYHVPSKKWRLTLPNRMFFEFDKHEDMLAAQDTFLKDFKRLEKGLHIIFYLNTSLCSGKERDMINRVQREMKCSKSQYGWLKGIQERQFKNAS